MPLLLIDDIPKLDGFTGNEQLTMEVIEKYLDVSLTLNYKEDGVETHLKFPFKQCQKSDFKKKKFELPSWY
jgi:hypothetical protein